MDVMDITKFLKYGAIGISLALAFFSYRLLSKEQEKTIVREEMLKSIKIYMILAVFLSVFFGTLEFTSKIFLSSENAIISNINEIWDRHFNSTADLSIGEKIEMIDESLDNPTNVLDTLEICDQYLIKLKNCQDELDSFGKGFYQNLILLQKELKNDPNGWTNLKHNTSKKEKIFASLREIFLSLGNDFSDLSNDQLIEKWILLKSEWKDEKLEYIFQSDIAQVIRKYLDNYS